MNILFHEKSGCIIFALFFLFIFSLMVFAEGLEPESGPQETSSYSIEDIFNRLSIGALGSQTTFTEPALGPVSGTTKSLNEIMAIAPYPDNDNGAGPEHVLVGKTFWGLKEGQWGPHIGTMNNAPVPKTGQTTSHRNGDAGHYQSGVSWPSPRFTDHGNGTVTDNLTGLMWTKNASHGQRTWNNAIDYCNALVHAGFSDWRLPNRRELFSLIDDSRWNPALPAGGNPFTGIASTSYYWSSSTFANNTDSAWYVSMFNGVVGTHFKSITYFVWPVRAGH